MLNGRIVKWILVLACILSLCAAFVVSASAERRTGVRFADAAELDALRADLAQMQPLPPSRGRLLIEGENAPFDAETNCYFVPQSPKTDALDGALSWSNGKQTAYLIMDPAFPGKAAALANGVAYRLLVRGGAGYYFVSVVFTGLPAVVIDFESDSSTFTADTAAIASVCVLDPDRGGAGVYGADRVQAELSLRGTSSINYEKKSYNLTIYDEKGMRSGLPLLGMRRDDQWILKSLLMDPLRTRECIASGIWNAISAEDEKTDPPTADFRYAEAFVDDAYEGLYGLMTKVDPADYGLDERSDILFRANSFAFLQYATAGAPLPDFSEGSVRFPKIWREGLYDPILWYVDAFYRRSASQTYAEAAEHLNLDNIVDYTLFYMLVSARDNDFSNSILLFRGAEDNFRLTLIPWDMDMTFGNSWDTVWTGSPLPLSETETVLLPQETRVLLELDEVAARDTLIGRWHELRGGALSDEALLQRADAALSLLETSGAIAREQARWTKPPVQRGGDYMLSYLSARTAFMDRYFS